MKHIAVMIKPASSLCNMRCRYCFYGDEAAQRESASFGVMRQETAEAVLERILCCTEAKDHLSICFQGGEPTLAGLPFFRSFIRTAKETAKPGVQIDFQLQTNGLLLDDDWCTFLKSEPFLVGLSLDGPKELHDGARPDAAEAGTFRRVLAAKERLEAHHVPYNVLTVLTGAIARHPKAYWRFLVEQKIGYAQLIPCLGPLDGTKSDYALTAERYASFYAVLFAEWKAALQKGEYISIKLFDDLINLLAHGEVNACGLLGSCQKQFVIEADGSVYPCDFYCLDRYRIGSLTEQTFAKLYESEPLSAFLSENTRPAACTSCPYVRICGGGCRRMRGGVYAGADGVCGHRLLLDRIGTELLKTAAAFRRR